MSESSRGILTNEQVEHFRTVFSMFDEDGGGSIDVMELKMAVKHLGCDENEAESLFYAMDENGDGSVDFDEFLKVMAFSVEAAQAGAAKSGKKGDEAGISLDMSGAVQAFRTFQVSSTKEYRQEGDHTMYTGAAMRKRKKIRMHESVIAWLTRFWRKVTSSDEVAVASGLPDEAKTLQRKTYVDFQTKMIKILFDEEDFNIREATQAAEEEWEREMAKELKARQKKGAFAPNSIGQQRFFESLYETIDVWTETAELKEYLDTFGHVYQNLTYFWEGDDTNERGQIRTLEDIRSFHATKYDDKDVGLAPPSYSAGPPVVRKPPKPPGTPGLRLAAVDAQIEAEVEAEAEAEAEAAGSNGGDSSGGGGRREDGVSRVEDGTILELAEQENEVVNGWTADYGEIISTDQHSASHPAANPVVQDVPLASSVITPFKPTVPVTPELGKKGRPVPVLHREPDVPVRLLARDVMLAAAQQAAATATSDSDRDAAAIKFGEASDETAPGVDDAMQRAIARAQQSGVPMPRPNMRTSLWGCADPRPMSAQLDDQSLRWRARDEELSRAPTEYSTSECAVTTTDGYGGETTNREALGEHNDILASLQGSQMQKNVGLAPMEMFFGLSSDIINTKAAAHVSEWPVADPDVDDLLDWAAQLTCERDNLDNRSDSSLGQNVNPNENISGIAVEEKDNANSPMVKAPPITDIELERIRHRIAAAAYSFGGQDFAALYRRIDESNNGLIALGEFHTFVRRVLHIPWEELPGYQIDELFELIDENGSMTIGFGELKAFVADGGGWSGYESPEPSWDAAVGSGGVAVEPSAEQAYIFPEESADGQTAIASLSVSWGAPSRPSAAPEYGNYSHLTDADDSVASIPTTSFVTGFEAPAQSWHESWSKAGSTLQSRQSGIKTTVRPELDVEYSYVSPTYAPTVSTTLPPRDEWTRKCPEKDRVVYPPVRAILEDAKAAALVYDPKNRTNVGCLDLDPAKYPDQARSQLEPKQPSNRATLSPRHYRSPRNGNNGGGSGKKKVAVLSAFALPIT